MVIRCVEVGERAVRVPIGDVETTRFASVRQSVRCGCVATYLITRSGLQRGGVRVTVVIVHGELSTRDRQPSGSKGREQPVLRAVCNSG